MSESKVIKLKGTQYIYVFHLCESDAVAAHRLEDAIAWYKDLTGLDDNELYPYEDMEVVEPNLKVHRSEDDPECR